VTWPPAGGEQGGTGKRPWCAHQGQARIPADAWQAVHDLLAKDGYRVAVVQNPTLSLEDDVAVTRRSCPQGRLPVPGPRQVPRLVRG
jgi:hypothetical protein